MVTHAPGGGSGWRRSSASELDSAAPSCIAGGGSSLGLRPQDSGLEVLGLNSRSRPAPGTARGPGEGGGRRGGRRSELFGQTLHTIGNGLQAARSEEEEEEEEERW